MKPSNIFIALCHNSEACKLEAYQDSGKVWTIGWGHTHDVKEGDKCTREQADQMFIDDCKDFTHWLDNQPWNLNQNQYDACLDLTYNIGPGNFMKDASLYSALKHKNEQAIRDGFMRHDKDRTGTVQPGLITRRKRELDLFFKPV